MGIGQLTGGDNVNDRNNRVWAEMLYRLALTFDLVQRDWDKLSAGQQYDWASVMGRVASEIAKTAQAEERQAA